MLHTTRTVIVDEIHAIADDKRGSHLSLTLARLDALGRASAPQRIGLSATVKPIEEVARISSARTRRIALSMSAIAATWISAFEFRDDELGAVATHEMWDELYDRLARH